MNCKHFGDSYDIVKLNLLQSLSPCGEWAVHPMFTDPKPPVRPKCRRFSGECADAGTCHDKNFRTNYHRFLGLRIINGETFDGSRHRRDACLSAARNCPEHLFLDPDTGIPFDSATGSPLVDLKSPVAAFLKADELVRIAESRPDKLTLVFDQSINNNGDATMQIKAKLRWFMERDIHGFVYGSHATFLLVSKNPKILACAKSVLLNQSRLPDDRLIQA